MGRFTAKDVLDPEDGSVLVEKNVMLTDKLAQSIEDAGIDKVAIRTVHNCQAKQGICARCYGMNLATGEETVIGEAVGIMAAQSIGEPGTQLTMRTFHTGGIASSSDITQGLPRVEELFEARKPKGQAIMCEAAGTVSSEEIKGKRRINVVGADNAEAISYDVPYGAAVLVKDGDYVESGDLITEGSVFPQDLMKIKGPQGVQKYIISEVIKVYNNNGVEINDKHVEIITRQMLRKVRIDDAGDTDLMTGTSVDAFTFRDANLSRKDSIPQAENRFCLVSPKHHSPPIHSSPRPLSRRRHVS